MSRRNERGIPAADLALLQRCRQLNEDIAELQRTLPEAQALDALAQLNLDDLAPDNRRMAALILRDKADFDTMQAELDALIIPAEEAAQRIRNVNLRRVAKLYCLDGLSGYAVKSSCSCCERTVDRCIAQLNRLPD